MGLLERLGFRRRPNDLGATHSELVSAIAKTFRMPRHVRAFKIEWRVGQAVVVTVEHFPWKSGPQLPATELALVTSQFEMREIGRTEKPLIKEKAA